MAEECTHDCASCKSDCKERSMTEKQNDLSRIGRVIAVTSGKGGVGKSTVTALLACAMRRRGYSVAVLDADITGPSIPKAFGVAEKAYAEGGYLLPAETATGIKVMSLNMLLEDDGMPVVWRGSLISGTVKQFWTDVAWGDVDFMFVDMPPGTGDVPLTVFQSLPVTGAVIVATPQELVGMIVEKAIRMAEMMNVPVLGLVENMAYFRCPHCGEKSEIFGASRLAETAQKFGIVATGQMPVDPQLAAACDGGAAERAPEPEFDALLAALLAGTEKKGA